MFSIETSRMELFFSIFEGIEIDLIFLQKYITKLGSLNSSYQYTFYLGTGPSRGVYFNLFTFFALISVKSIRRGGKFLYIIFSYQLCLCNQLIQSERKHFLTAIIKEKNEQ